jgi:O-methyltransferase
MNEQKTRSYVKKLRIVLFVILGIWAGITLLGVAVVFEALNTKWVTLTPIPPKEPLRLFKKTDTSQEMYLELLKVVLTRYGLDSSYKLLINPKARLGRVVSPWIRHARIVQVEPFEPRLREHGRDWPLYAETMIGLRRLDSLQDCITDVLRRDVPGDLIECGAWRGGACIFMRAVLKVFGDADRKVWAADSFEGIPIPDPTIDAQDAQLWAGRELAVSVEEAKQNFVNYGLLDEQVRFLKGFFIDTLPGAPIESLSVLRIDCDLYDSVMQSLEYLYSKVSIGGYVIIDDYGALPPARRAVEDYRRSNGITEEIVRIDWTGVYWIKEH